MHYDIPKRNHILEIFFQNAVNSLAQTKIKKKILLRTPSRKGFIDSKLDKNAVFSLVRTW